MSEIFFVRIDVPKLCERLRSPEGSPRRFSHGDAFVWLQDHGFKMTRRGWLARDEALLTLDEGELVSRQPIL